MYYFEDDQNKKNLEAILNSWCGTPWKHHTGVKGMGVDCIHFVARVFEELGLVKWRKDFIPDYPKDWHLHQTRELLIERLEQEANFEKIPIAGIKDGDIILSHYGRAAAHAGIYFGGYVYQSIVDIGVERINVDECHFRRRMKIAYRLIGPK